jgi:hypothetical protein
MAWELSSEALIVMLEALDNAGLYVSAHTADPGVDGSNEVVGGTYARISVPHNGATGSGGTASMALTSTAQLNIPGTPTTVSYLGIWNHISNTAQANWMGRVDIADEVFSSDGTLDVTALTIALDQVPA